MFADRTYRAVILGSLLHDIGKLLQRGSFGAIDIRGQHPQVSADFISAFRDFFGQWVDADLLQTLVQRHHENSQHFPQQLLAQHTPDPDQRGLAFLVSKADNLSSSERGKAHDQYQDFRKVPLATVFRGVEVEGRFAATSANYHAGGIASPASLDILVPESFDEYEPEELNEQIRGFGQEFSRLTTTLENAGFPALLSHLTNLLYRFSWCIPANTQEDSPDVSLYDHLRTTCAIAACLYQRHKGAPSLEAALRGPIDDFIVVAGDISGIQDHIFQISRLAGGGIARRLRARSLSVQLITEAASRLILEQLDLPHVCEIMASGGNFYLLLPNTRETTLAISSTAEELDRWCLDELHGELSVHLASAVVGSKSFQIGRPGASGFGEALADVKTRLSVEKNRRFHRSLAGENGWSEGSFLIDVSYQGQDSCPSCRRFPPAPGAPEGICSQCQRDRDVGARLARARAFRFQRGPGLPIRLPGWSADVVTDLQRFGSEDVAGMINSLDFSEIGGRDASGRFMANHLPTVQQDGNPRLMTFEEIAQRSTGRPMLGFLKMDVDNLGELFVFGLKRSDGSGDRDTISRVTTLSRMLDTFFTGRIQHLLQEKFNNCYTVFSGGDDLLVLGPWNEVLDLAVQVNEDFHQWTGRPDITISGGVLLTHPRYPMYRAAQQVDAQLARSKEAGRNRFTAFGETRRWEQWIHLWTLSKEFMGEIQQVSSSALFRLKEYGDMWQRWLESTAAGKPDSLALKAQPLLAYTIGREGLGRSRLINEWARGLVDITPGADTAPGGFDDLSLISRLLILAKGGRVS